MNLDLDPTQELLQGTVRDYLEAHVPFDRVRALEREGSWDEALWKGFCEQGWLGLPLPEALGGGGGSLVDLGLLVLEVARRAAPVPVAEALACAVTIAREVPPARAAALVEALGSGAFLPVPAVLEADDAFDRAALPLADGRVRGEKRFVDYAACATHHLLVVREGGDAGGPALALVDAHASGVACTPLFTIGRTPSSVVRYDGAPAERVAGAAAVGRLVALGRALAAVQCVGSAERALEMTVAYASVREAFGRPIGSFQAVKHHAANMATRVAASRHLAFEALAALDAGRAAEAQVALAKASASRTVPEVTMLAHQIHGGNGVIEENDLYFFTLRGKERSLAWGSVDECLAIVADAVHEPVDWHAMEVAGDGGAREGSG